MSQETASVLGNSYRIYSLKYIPYTHSTCRIYSLLVPGILESRKLLAKSLLEGEIVPKLPPVLSKAPEQGLDYLRFDRNLQRRTQTNVLQPKRCHQLPSRDAVGIFCKPTFYPNHRARNPHPGEGLDPLLGPRIFRALRLGPFEGFPASM